MFASAERLSIEGFGGEPVPNQFLRQADDTRDLALFLPGMGYTCDMPLFYYAQNLLEDGGSDLLRVEYDYGHRPEFRMLSFAEQVRWLFADATAAYRAGRNQRAYRRITFVGKSLGTLAIGHLLTTETDTGMSTRAVWLTPLIRDAALYEQMRQYRGRSLLAIGTADPAYDAEILGELSALEAMETVVIEGADHGLDIAGDVVGSIEAVGRTVRALGRFLGE